ncbi:MAG: recombinase family protein [Pseudonocardiaceae bacterium]
MRDLNEAAHHTAWDRDWTTVGTRDMLRRPRNAGLTSYSTETFPAAWPAIVPEATWRAVVFILSDPQRAPATGSNGRSGRYVCGVCGRVCGRAAPRVTQTGGKYQPAYRCKARDNTRQSGYVTRAAPALDDYIERIIVARLQRPYAAAISQRLTDLSAAFAEGASTLAQLRTGTGKLRDRLTDIEDILAAAPSSVPSAPVTVLPTSRGRRPDGSYSIPPESN